MKKSIFVIIFVLFSLGCANVTKGSAKLGLSFGKWVAPFFPNVVFEVSIEQEHEVKNGGNKEG